MSKYEQNNSKHDNVPSKHISQKLVDCVENYLEVIKIYFIQYEQQVNISTGGTQIALQIIARTLKLIASACFPKSLKLLEQRLFRQMKFTNLIGTQYLYKQSIDSTVLLVHNPRIAFCLSNSQNSIPESSWSD